MRKYMRTNLTVSHFGNYTNYYNRTSAGSLIVSSFMNVTSVKSCLDFRKSDFSPQCLAPRALLLGQLATAAPRFL